MPGITGVFPYISARCLRAQARRHVSQRFVSSGSPTPRDDDIDDSQREREEGAMSRRLQQMSDESLETSNPNARQAVEDAGFSEDLKRELEEKIANAAFRSENAAAFAQANLPGGAAKHTRDIAAAAPWTGTESVEDASLRMLNDSHRPLRGPQRLSGGRVTPATVDTGRPVQKQNAGFRIASARERTSIYSIAKDTGLSEEEKEKFRKQMKQRFEVGARDIPASIQGLASLANRRVEDAIARGQFKNLPRGQKIERDYTANSPFIDTTEYFMNKLIKKQDIVPPWIEKQQEVITTAARFRSRLRSDWKRHVARVIASRGGSLESQLQLAEQYAAAERAQNPSKQQVEIMNSVDEGGHVSQITITGQLVTNDQSAAAEEIRVEEKTLPDASTPESSTQEIIVTAEQPTPAAPIDPTIPPFRDPQWEQTERSYHIAAIDNLNNLTRSYNLMAPNLAKKPYFSLDRELKACFAEVAPQVGALIQERALAPKIRGVEVVGHKPGGVLEKFAMDRAGHVYDERKPQYGFKEFWKDLWATRT